MDYIRAQGREIYAGNTPILLRGFGLGGWFLPEGYMWKLYQGCDRPRKMEALIKELCGEVYAESFWESYLESYITEKDIEFIAKEGFNSIRLPLNGRQLYQKASGLAINLKLFLKIDEIITWCRKHQIYVILDMHGAPGGQTGQNIDDSEADHPELFVQPEYVEELVFLWSELAKRYCNEPVIAGYDLLNEPLPNFFNQYNDRLLPLYRRLIREIRAIDSKHMIILEGLHWATDFTVFDQFTREEAADNIMLQFHKYWSNPDSEGIQSFISKAEELDVPLFMGEGGENNCDWYTTAFPMYEQHNISWNFWSYKKMECTNSPVTFDVPEGWNELIGQIKGEGSLISKRAMEIFQNFLHCIQNPRINQRVMNALKREVPVKIPCEAYNSFLVRSERTPGATLRMSDPVTILFKNGKKGTVDYSGRGGDEQPEEETLLVGLTAGDKLGYRFLSYKNELKVTIVAGGSGKLKLASGLTQEQVLIEGDASYDILLTGEASGYQTLWLSCEEGILQLDYIYLQ